MEKLKELLNASNNELNEKINKIREEQNYSEVINIIEDVLNNKKIEEEKIDKLVTTFEKIKVKYSDQFQIEEQNKMDFTIILLKKGKKFDNTQTALYTKIKALLENNLSNDDIEKLEEKISKNKFLISKLDPSKHFESFEELEGILNSIDVDLKYKLDLLREIIIKNANYSITNVPEEEEIIYVYNNSEEDIYNIIKKYYNEEDIKIKGPSMELLKKHTDLKKMEEILEILNELYKSKKINKLDVKKKTFAIIMAYSTPELIKEFIQLCNKYQIDIKKLLEKNEDLLYESKYPKDGVKFKGKNEYFKENIEFISNKGLIIPYIDRPEMFASDSKIVKRNWEILKNVYGVQIKEKGISSLGEKLCIDNFDRWIEASEFGYDYIKSNLSRILSMDQKIFYRIRILEEEAKQYSEPRRNNTRLLYENENTGEYKVRGSTTYSVGDTAKNKFAPVKIDLPLEKVTKYDKLTVPYLEEIRPEVFENEYVKKMERNIQRHIDENVPKINEFVYILNRANNLKSTIISRKKFLRICNMFVINGIEIGEDEIKYALSYNSITNANDVENIDNFKNFLQSELNISLGGIWNV